VNATQRFYTVFFIALALVIAVAYAVGYRVGAAHAHAAVGAGRESRLGS
jgi:hypothetical protein